MFDRSTLSAFEAPPHHYSAFFYVTCLCHGILLPPWQLFSFKEELQLGFCQLVRVLLFFFNTNSNSPQLGTIWKKFQPFAPRVSTVDMHFRSLLLFLLLPLVSSYISPLPKQSTQTTWVPSTPKQSTVEPRQFTKISTLLHFTSSSSEFPSDIPPHIEYYNKVTRRPDPEIITPTVDRSARKIYLARKAIADLRSHQAELIYRDSLSSFDDSNVRPSATLLLALLLQRNRTPVKKTRSVFLSYLRSPSPDNPAGTARVLQAFALFESKNRILDKSKYLIDAACELDPSLEPVKKWRMFQECDHHPKGEE